MILLVFLLFSGPIAIIAGPVHNLVVQARNIHHGRCGDHVAVVDAAQRDAIRLERAGDQKNALLKVSEEDDALAAEATGEEDQDGARRERIAIFGSMGGFAGLEVLG